MKIAKTILINVIPPEKPQQQAEEEIAELRRLVETYGGIVVVEILQKRGRPSSKTFLGTGKAVEAAEIAKKHGVDMVIFNDFLKPHHAQNLSKLFSYDPNDITGRSNIPIWDRTDIILNIFEKHAKSQIAQLQIQLARLKHQIPKIYQYQTRLFDRERGGIRGTRGGGEKGIEDEKRHIREKIKDTEKRLVQLQKTHASQREQRKRIGLKTVALVGYTNVGKSTLLKTLTGKNTEIRDELFTTLDTRIGSLWLPDPMIHGKGQKILLADTIGFIQNLPPHLIESFKATLAEVREADLILHVIDSADPFQELKIGVVEDILKDLVPETTPVIRVFNKSDIQKICYPFHRNQLHVSALEKISLDLFKTLIYQFIQSP